MIHAGKNPRGELELILTGEQISTLLSMIKGSGLPERRVFFQVRELIETEFSDMVKSE